MDRRQRKTRAIIFAAFIDLLSEKDFAQITVSEIIDRADIGRSTFYAHFETRDYLLKELCEDLFCHIFDAENSNAPEHSHMFECDAPDTVFLHLLRHLMKDDNHILKLLACKNNDLFLRYFKENLQIVAANQLPLFEMRKNGKLPDDFWIHHIVSTFTETVRWWIDHGMKETPETIFEYFCLTV